MSRQTFSSTEEAATHEPFVFPGRAGFNFCKTNGKLYDAAVTACLLVARDHFSPDELKIDSDGQWEDGDWNAGAKLYQQVLGRAAANPINRSDEPPAGPGIDLPDRPEEWGPVSLLVVAGIGLGIVWLLVRPHWSFIIFVEQGRIDRVRGDAPRPFLLEVDDICRQFEIPRATIREMQALRATLLLFSRNSRRVPPENSRKLAGAPLTYWRRRTLRLPSTTSDYLLVSLKVGTTGGGPAVPVGATSMPIVAAVLNLAGIVSLPSITFDTSTL